jgi:rhamnose transport system substrate-binding protein
MSNDVRGFGRGAKATRREAIVGMAGGLLAASAGALSAPVRAASQKVIGLVPKFTSDPYFIAANQGAQEAAKELKLTVQYNGPVDANVAAQSDIIDRMVRARVDALAVCANDPDALAPALIRASRKGIKVSTWDADVRSDARQVFLSQASADAVGRAIIDIMVSAAGTSGDFLLVTGSLTATNMIAWMGEIRKQLATRYPGITIKAVLDGNEDIEKAKNISLNYLRANPKIRGVFVVDGISSIGVSEAVEQLKLAGKVAVAGIGVPNSIRPYVKNGTVSASVLWNPVDIGYAAICIANSQLEGTLNPAAGSVSAGRLGKLKFVSKDVVLLGPPLVFTQQNIDQYRF